MRVLCSELARPTCSRRAYYGPGGDDLEKATVTVTEQTCSLGRRHTERTPATPDDPSKQAQHGSIYLPVRSERVGASKLDIWTAPVGFP